MMWHPVSELPNECEVVLATYEFKNGERVVIEASYQDEYGWTATYDDEAIEENRRDGFKAWMELPTPCHRF